MATRSVHWLLSQTPNGKWPQAGLLADAKGNLYGTTDAGGTSGSGTVFKLDASNNYALATLVNFTGANGSTPQGTLIADANGNFYGTTSSGGAGGFGTVFKLDASNNYSLTTLASFNLANGSTPLTRLLMDTVGNIFGTSHGGGANNWGTVFELNASANYALSTLVTFDKTNNGSLPDGDLVSDAAGNLYGTTLQGGANNDGTVYQITGSGFVVPEPGSAALCGFGILMSRRRWRPRVG